MGDHCHVPRQDGFELCLEMRRDEVLVRIPVVLTSAAYCDDADRVLGDRVGASAYVPRTPAFEGVIEALSRALVGAAPPASGGVDPSVRDAHFSRVAHQLDRVAVQHAHLTQACTVQQSVLTMLGTLASSACDDLGRTLGEMLESCVDFQGARAGAFYVCEQGRLGGRSWCGASPARARPSRCTSRAWRTRWACRLRAPVSRPRAAPRPSWWPRMRSMPAASSGPCCSGPAIACCWPATGRMRCASASPRRGPSTCC